MNTTSDLAHNIDGILRKRTEEETFSGVVRITAGDDEVFAGAYGLASRPWQIPNRMETRFDTASLTKLFTTVAALQLVDEGSFDLDTRVMPYLGLRGTAISDEVTLFQLLTHSSGIGDDAEEEAGEDYADLWKEKPNYAVTQTADFLPQFVQKPPNFPPGKGCRYNNCGFILAGLMIEKAAGRPFRDVVIERVFEPAGMADSGFFRLDRVAPNLAEGADPIQGEGGGILGWQKNIYSFPPIGSPDSGAHVTAADLDRFLRAARRGELLSPEMTKRLFTPQVDYYERETWTARYGLGLWFRVEPDGRALFCQKEGYNDGVSAVMRYVFDQDLNLVILSNMAEGAWAPTEEIHNLIVSDEGRQSEDDE